MPAPLPRNFHRPPVERLHQQRHRIVLGREVRIYGRHVFVRGALIGEDARRIVSGRYRLDQSAPKLCGRFPATVLS